MPYQQIAPAFMAEATVLAQVVADLTQAELDRSSPCPAWTNGELLCHVVIAVRRIAEVQTDDGSGELVTTVGYYRHDHRFSAVVNAGRIDSAVTLCQSLGSAASIAAALDAACREGHGILMAACATAAVRTRHGDRMLLTDFAQTRVVELALHGLDLAAGLGRPPWMTPEAAAVVEDLLVPAGTAARLRTALGCDQTALIARLTGRIPLPGVQADLLREHNVTQLALG